MTYDAMHITKLLKDVRGGSPEAANQLMEAVYTDLRAIARRSFADERPDHTLQPTALVHEAWMRLFNGAEIDWRDRSHFFAIAGRQMRRILVDHGREVHARKRGCGLKVALNDNLHNMPAQGCEIGLVDDLLQRLHRLDPEAAKVVEMKFFAGLTDEEAASALGYSHSTVRRHWSFARAWLRRQITGTDCNGKN